MRQFAALQEKSLFISAGHSDSDPGAVGNGHTEANIVLEFRDLLAEYLGERVIVDKDGTDGKNLPLRDAVGAAKAHDLAVEFHCNAAASQAATGVETLSAGHHYPLGNALCHAIADALGIANRGAKGEASGQHSRLAFIRQGGGVIVELFFLSNKRDLAKYIANRRRCVEAVGDVLINEICAPALEYSA
ncbi:N-acetylmuramoyl-L-alanine amidase [Halomonas sp. DP5N14-9]|uniref:N-acetylmuramoyl-L-alanine amidase n=1 Tax=unclassified Halomonas TaxID=2609666 RepID=UPI000D3D500E|nr:MULTISPECIES: N-acetylmuramoyl-L-alanine amidase [unclassified Halomonas]MBY5940384.1 N-acetylmuramoyl-L-alanine amidase [Halomonas sp. DP5N14-9]